MAGLNRALDGREKGAVEELAHVRAPAVRMPVRESARRARPPRAGSPLARGGNGGRER